MNVLCVEFTIPPCHGFRWWKSELEKKEAEKSAPGDKTPNKFSPSKRFKSKHSTTKVSCMANRGFVSTEPRPVIIPSRHEWTNLTAMTSNDTDSNSSETDDDGTHGNATTEPQEMQSINQSQATELLDDAKLDRRENQKNPKLSQTPLSKKVSTSKKRYILFFGNLSEASTHEDLINHFQKRGVPIKELRLLTYKDTGKPRGCAFADFENERCLMNALKFHRSVLNGKTINVEVTCGGGGSSQRRKSKILDKNHHQRIAKARKSMAV